jgi:hypothetical protein
VLVLLYALLMVLRRIILLVYIIAVEAVIFNATYSIALEIRT